jgi:hypothetical protein
VRAFAGFWGIDLEELILVAVERGGEEEIRSTNGDLGLVMGSSSSSSEADDDERTFFLRRFAGGAIMALFACYISRQICRNSDSGLTCLMLEQVEKRRQPKLESFSIERYTRD